MLDCITIDDSKVQLKLISGLVNKIPSLNLIGEYTSAIEARKALKNKKVDLIFLDIEMSVISGFDFLDSLDKNIQVIIISRKKEYAYDAFKYNVSGFILKPVNKEDFNRSVDRSILLYEKLYSNYQAAKISDDVIFVKSNLINKKVYLKDIKWIEAVGDYVKVVSDKENYIVLSTMKGFINKLPQDKFIRIHKSFIVNLNRVEKFNNKFVEVENTELPLSRTKKNKLFEALNAN
ncbi:MAG: response regulator transcription factor [Flavobacteriales bacterium]|nr:response regulator transcription factor [Flavobacteriales bacterium]